MEAVNAAGEPDSPNLALIRRAYDAFNRRDASELVEIVHPDAEIYPYVIEHARATGYKGYAGLLRYGRDVMSTFEEFRVEIDEYSEPAQNVVYARGRIRGRRRDGQEIDMLAGWLWSLEEGRVVRMQADPRKPHD